MRRLIVTRSMADEVDNIVDLTIPSDIIIDDLAFKSGLQQISLDVAVMIAERLYIDISNLRDVKCWFENTP